MELPDISGLFGPQDFEREARQKLELKNQILNEAAREKAISRTDKAVLPVVAGIQAGAMHDFGQSIKNMLGNAFQSKPGTIDGLFPTAAEQQPVEITTAITRDRDSKELREMFSNLQKDGDITLEGKNALVDEMLRRGYPGQAKKFHDIWQSRYKNVTARVKAENAANKGSADRYKTEKIVKHRIMSGENEGKEVLRLVVFDKQTGNTTIGWSDETGKKIAAPTGKLSALNALDQTDIDVLNDREEFRNTVNFYAKDLASHKGKVDKNTAEYKEKLRRTTSELQMGLNVSEHKANIMAEAQLATREENLQKGIAARMALPQIRNLLKLSETRSSGGDISAAWKTLKRAFGYENKGDAEFRTGSQMLMIENLKKIFGPRATDKDMEELKKAFAREGQPTPANIAILRKWVDKTRTAQDIGDYFANNPDATTATYSKWIKERYETIPDKITKKFPDARLEGGRIYIIRNGHKLELKR